MSLHRHLLKHKPQLMILSVLIALLGITLSIFIHSLNSDTKVKAVSLEPEKENVVTFVGKDQKIQELVPEETVVLEATLTPSPTVLRNNKTKTLATFEVEVR
jgi:hypothetical protein